MSTTARVALASTIAAMAGVAAGALAVHRLHHVTIERQYASMTVAAAASDRTLINPLLDCHESQPAEIAAYAGLHAELQSYIHDAQEDGRIERASVFVRVLTTGPSLGIDEDLEYAPASLLKVPIMVAALRQAEDSLELLQRRYRFSDTITSVSRQNIRDSTTLEPGRWYTEAELIEYMIQHSDNAATEMLRPVVGSAAVMEVLQEMSIVEPSESMRGDYISVKDYASVFRLLFNSTYLGREMSSRALEILSRSTFDAGIPALLPAGTRVAHKFGERGSPGGPKQLHDCGIVYAGDSPYVICIMTQGYNFDELASIIARLSRIAYDEVTRLNR